jgi:hypothetical protein
VLPILTTCVERRWQARMFDRHGEIQVTDLVFHRDGEPVGGQPSEIWCGLAFPRE